jgi:hypothetical protein
MFQNAGKVVDTFWEATLNDLEKVSSRIETCQFPFFHLYHPGLFGILTHIMPWMGTYANITGEGFPRYAGFYSH